MLRPSTRSIKWGALVIFGTISVEVQTFSTPQIRGRLPLTSPHILLSRTQYRFHVDRTSQRKKWATIRYGQGAEEEEPTGEQQQDEQIQHLEDDIAQRMSVSKDRAISALSQPKDEADEDNNDKERGPKASRNKNERRRKRQSSKKKSSSSSSFLPPPSLDEFNLPSAQRTSPSNTKSETTQSTSSYSSLLPPPLPSLGTNQNDNTDDSALPSGLSSWEEFLGGSSDEPTTKKAKNKRRSTPTPKDKDNEPPTISPNDSDNDTTSSLPSISDLFPPEVSSTGTEGLENTALEGVLPVSELFYRSSQSISAQDDDEEDRESERLSEMKSERDVVDDEELPFSAEQSDQLMIDDGKVKIRRNRAKSQKHDRLVEEMASSVAAASSRKPSKRKKKGRGRKMVRRGMEMLVGGTPINADPPQRCIELSYIHPKCDADWSRAITLNSRDFGPLLHSSSVGLVTPVEQGLYCEHFVNAAMKWDICPKDLKGIVKTHTLEQMMQDNNERVEEEEEAPTEVCFDSYNDLPSTSTMLASLNSLSEAKKDIDASPDDPMSVFRRPEADNSNILSLLTVNDADADDVKEKETESKSKASEPKQRGKTAAKGFGKTKPPSKKDIDMANKALRKELESMGEMGCHLGGEIKFSIGVTRTELESGRGGAGGNIFRRVIARGIETAIESELKGFFRVVISRLVMSEGEAGSTHVDVDFMMESRVPVTIGRVDQTAARINAALTQAMEDGDVQLAMAAVAKEEKAWPAKVRARVVEEFLFEEDDADEPLYEEEDDSFSKRPGKRPTSDNRGSGQMEANEEYDGPFGMPGCSVYAKDDIFLGGGNGGVFYDYSEASIQSSPFKGELGPILVDAAVARTRQREPRVIAIGDVHGCIDELQDLLRRCDYQPGDVVCFLGDLVSKGPDSISVVQLAREIGAIGVRGNHDFEVIRWHQAIKSGVDPPVVGSEHFHIASCLTTADMKWLYSLPWYISSRELGALFVHAGFVSGIRLAKQNPRLMMNMRSILPDGTVTSKFFNNWPWARLWDGPQTVLFGHDADRGLQQYEHAIGLDTGCVYGGRLTACILPEKRLVSVSARREYFKYRRKHYD